MTDDAIIMSVALKSGKFESSVSVPTSYTKADCEEMVAAWLEMLSRAMKVAGNAEPPVA